MSRQARFQKNTELLCHKGRLTTLWVGACGLFHDDDGKSVAVFLLRMPPLLSFFWWLNCLFGPFNFTYVNLKKRPVVAKSALFSFALFSFGSCPCLGFYCSHFIRFTELLNSWVSWHNLTHFGHCPLLSIGHSHSTHVYWLFCLSIIGHCSPIIMWLYLDLYFMCSTYS